MPRTDRYPFRPDLRAKLIEVASRAETINYLDLGVGRAMGMHNNRFNSTRAYDLLGRLGFSLHSTELDGPVPDQGVLGEGDVPASFDRQTALGLAVQLYAGSGVEPATILSTASAFGAWLEGGVE